MSDDRKANWGMVLAFDSDEGEYVRGFEGGCLWRDLERLIDDGADFAEQEPWLLHAANAEMVLRMAEALGLTARSTELDDDWISVTFECAPAPGPGPGVS